MDFWINVGLFMILLGIIFSILKNIDDTNNRLNEKEFLKEKLKLIKRINKDYDDIKENLISKINNKNNINNISYEDYIDKYRKK